MEKSQVLVRINNSGNAAASMRAASYYSKGAKVTDDISGIAYYEYLKDFEEHFEEKADDFIKLCWEMQRRILRPENLTVSTTGDGQALALAKLEIPGILEKLYTKEFPEEHMEVHCVNKNEAFKTPAQIQYVARAGSFRRAGFEYSGAMKILKTALSYDYFWINIRVKGGAYGCHGAFSRYGTMTLSSYRDPNLRETNEVFEGTDTYVKNFDVDERDMTKYIIGTVSGMDTPLTPYQEGIRSFSAYMSGITAAC
jgi:Zn-dependent M16 (insulinase) family peptidase